VATEYRLRVLIKNLADVYFWRSNFASSAFFVRVSERFLYRLGMVQNELEPM
jgi:hypothetical protein